MKRLFTALALLAALLFAVSAFAGDINLPKPDVPASSGDTFVPGEDTAHPQATWQYYNANYIWNTGSDLIVYFTDGTHVVASQSSSRWDTYHACAAHYNATIALYVDNSSVTGVACRIPSN